MIHLVDKKDKITIQIGNEKIPLGPLVKKMEEVETTKVLKEEIQIINKQINRTRPLRGIVRFCRNSGRTGRMRKLKDDEIRKRYGIMARKFRTDTENVLWLLSENEQLTVQQMAKLLERGKESISTTMRRVFLNLPEWVEVVPDTKPMSYRKKQPIDVSNVYALWKERYVPIPKKIKEKEEKSKTADDPIFDFIRKTVTKAIAEEFLGYKPSVVGATVDPAKTDKGNEVNVHISVNGDIKFLFGLVR